MFFAFTDSSSLKKCLDFKKNSLHLCYDFSLSFFPLSIPSLPRNLQRTFMANGRKGKHLFLMGWGTHVQLINLSLDSCEKCI